MAVDEALLDEARQARDRFAELQHETNLAQVGYQHAIRRLHASGASLREIADALGLSYQRVHQVVDPASGKCALKRSKVTTSCSFCGLLHDEVRTVIAGPGVGICDRCVDLADEVIAEGEPRADELTAMAAVDEPRARCSFCGRRRAQSQAIAEAPGRSAAGKFSRRRQGVRICSDCLGLANEILLEDLRPQEG